MPPALGLSSSGITGYNSGYGLPRPGVPRRHAPSTAPKSADATVRAAVYMTEWGPDGGRCPGREIRIRRPQGHKNGLVYPSVTRAAVFGQLGALSGLRSGKMADMSCGRTWPCRCSVMRSPPSQHDASCVKDGDRGSRCGCHSIRCV